MHQWRGFVDESDLLLCGLAITGVTWLGGRVDLESDGVGQEELCPQDLLLGVRQCLGSLE